MGLRSTGDGVYALGGDAGDVADASPGLSSSVFLHIFRLAKRTARADRPADEDGVVSLEVLFNMTVDGIRRTFFSNIPIYSLRLRAKAQKIKIIFQVLNSTKCGTCLDERF
jgi:hypothetical protein